MCFPACCWPSRRPGPDRRGDGRGPRGRPRPARRHGTEGPGPAARRGGCASRPAAGPVVAPAPTGEVTVEGLVVDPDRLDGTAPKDLAPLLGEADVLPGLLLAQSSRPPRPAR